MKSLLIVLLFPVCVASQWPGYFYAFTLTDSTGKLITAGNKDYTFKIIKPAGEGLILDVLMCSDSSTIRFYAGGNHGLYDAHKLEIIKVSDNTKMTIEFPPSISGGKDKYFRNLFIGNLNFKAGDYQIKLPASDAAWDDLKEKHFCPDYGGVDSYWDISNLQRQ